MALLRTGSAVLSDLFQFDPATAEWTDLGVGASGPQPTPRFAMGIAAWSGGLYLFGGCNIGKPVPPEKYHDPFFP